MIKLAISFILFFFLVISYSCQSVTILLVDDFGVPIKGVNIIIKNGQGEIIQFGKTNENGEYTLSEINNLSGFKIEFTKLGFEKQVFAVKDLAQISTINLNSITELSEIKVSAKNTGIRQREDTTIYDVKSFKDGTEKSIEELLKKLPGIEVDNSGKIKFKGREISHLLIEGDDMLSANYSIATKNISSDILKSVEAYENYNENILLKGLENSNKVALNLILEDRKSDFSFPLTIGLGYENRQYYKLNSIGLAKKNKNISLSSYNNIGENDSGYDLMSNTSLERLSQPYTYNRIANIQVTHLPLNRKYYVSNKSWINNVDNLLKIDSVSSLKFNLHFITDNLKQSLFQVQELPGFEWKQNNNYQNKPSVLGGSLQFKKNYAKSILSLSINSEKWHNKESDDYQYNNIPNLSKLVTTENINTGKIEFTHLFNKYNVVKLESQINQFNQLQSLNFRNGIDFLDFTATHQNINLDYRIYINSFSYYTLMMGNKLNSTIFYELVENHLETKLNNLVSNNSLHYSNRRYGINILYSLQYKKMIFTLKLLPFILNNANFNYSKSHFNGSLVALKRLNKKNSIRSEIELNTYPINVDELYNNYIIINNNTIEKSSTSFQTSKHFKIKLGYSLLNYKRISNIEFLGQFINISKNWITDFYYTENNDNLLLNIVTKKNNISNWKFSLKFEKKIEKINNSFSFSTDYNYFNQPVSYNNSIQKNEFQNLEFKTEITSFFKGKFNYNIIIKYTYGKNFSFSNTYQLLQLNPILLFVFSENFYSKLSFSNILNQSSSFHTNFSLLDWSMNYKINKNSSASIQANNLFNTKNYTQYSINSFMTSKNSVNILPLNIILKYTFSF